VPPKSIVIGCTGFIGRHFYHHLQNYYPDIIGTDRRGKTALDLKNPQLTFDVGGHSWAIIATGYATPKRCYDDYSLCRQLDLDGVVNLSKQLVDKGIIPVIFSTSQVFDGSQSLYYPESKTSPVNLYGVIHAEREERLLEELKGRCLILRLCRVYAANGGTVLDIITELMQRGEITAATDQILQLVNIEEVMAAIFALQSANKRGIYQISPEDSVSRYEMACYIAQELGVSVSNVKKITMSDIDNIPRPKCAFLASCYNVQSWKEGVDQVVKQYRKIALGKCQESFSR